MNTIDITKKYRTRDGRAVTGLRHVPDNGGGYVIEGEIMGVSDGPRDDAWTIDGLWFSDRNDHCWDLVLAEDQEPEKPVPMLITPDPLRVEYGAFVSAVKVNFAAGTFATATQSQFDAWLESLTPSLRV